MQIETATVHVHTITVRVPASEEDVVVVSDGQPSVAASVVTAEITADADGTLHPYKTSWRAEGVAMRRSAADPFEGGGGLVKGTRKRVAVGGNLNRLPAVLVDAIIAAAEGLGVVGLREDIEKTRRPSLHNDQ